jgi:ribosomal protein S18 acetylase RimI-like enzyme
MTDPVKLVTVGSTVPDPVKVLTVDSSNVDEHGFFCYKSKRKSDGYRRKVSWVQAHGTEDLGIKILFEGERSVGFIEYADAAHSWRVVEAPSFLVVHCLWVIGKAKKKGYGSVLVRECVEEARRRGKRGVAVVTSKGNWLAGEKGFLKNGFEVVGSAPPTFKLLVKSFSDGPEPCFPMNWDERIGRFGPGVTVVYADQCPYMPDAVNGAVSAFQDRGLEVKTVRMESSGEVRERAPSAYGVFGIVWDGTLFSYHYLGRKELKLLDERLM